MSHDTLSLGEWAEFLSLGLVPVGLLRLTLALFAEPDPGYYRAAAFDAAVTVAALLMLLTLTAPPGGTR